MEKKNEQNQMEMTQGRNLDIDQIYRNHNYNGLAAH